MRCGSCGFVFFFCLLFVVFFFQAEDGIRGRLVTGVQTCALPIYIESAFLSVTADDPVGKAVLEGEACDNFVRGVDVGWEMIEKAAEAEGLLF